MKKSLLFSLVILLLFIGNLFAEGGKFSLWGGYTTVNMKDANNIIDQVESAYTNILSDERIKIKNAFIVGVDYFFNTNEYVSFGTRLAYLKTNEGKAKLKSESYSTVRNNAGTLTRLKFEENYNVDINTSLLPIMVGSSIKKNLNDKFTINGKFFAGYGLISFEIDETESEDVYDTNTGAKEYSETRNTPYSKNTGCLVTDISIGAEYSFTEKFALGFDLGYRYTPKTTIEGDFKVDFSGLSTTVSLNYKF